MYYFRESGFRSDAGPSEEELQRILDDAHSQGGEHLKRVEQMVLNTRALKELNILRELLGLEQVKELPAEFQKLNELDVPEDAMFGFCGLEPRFVGNNLCISTSDENKINQIIGKCNEAGLDAKKRNAPDGSVALKINCSKMPNVVKFALMMESENSK